MKKIVLTFPLIIAASVVISFSMSHDLDFDCSNFSLIDNNFLGISYSSTIYDDSQTENLEYEYWTQDFNLNAPDFEHSIEQYQELFFENNDQENIDLQTTSSEETLHDKEEATTYTCFWNGLCATFKSAQDLQDHIHENHATRRERFTSAHQCLWKINDEKICGKILYRFDSFRSHILSHTEHKQFSCNDCSQTFISKKYLNDHIRRVHKYHQKKYTCPYCYESFLGLYNYRKHIALETGNQPRCPQCQKVFSTKSSLRVHLKTVHEKIRAFACTTCDRTFSQNGHLKNHQAKCGNC